MQFFSILALAAVVKVSPAASPDKNSRLFAGFKDARLTTTFGGHATCISGTVPVNASAVNYHINLLSYFPQSQTALMQLIQSLNSVNSTKAASITGATTNVSGTFYIDARLCYPTSSSPNAGLIQVLNPGGGTDMTCWDFYSKEYSYIDAAAKAGYTTFAFSHLGTGNSAHPDGIQIVQIPLQIQIAHELILLVRSSALASTPFKHVIGIGHSYGSQQTNAISSLYPTSLDALVLTGFITNGAGEPVFLSDLNRIIANKADPARFHGIPNAYIIPGTKSSNQFSFFY
jgi:hypothetical protein